MPFDRFIKRGGPLNGMVLGNGPEVFKFYQTQVVGGPGAFVMTAHALTPLLGR